MGEFTTGANNAYPGIPTITEEPQVQLDALANIKEALEIHERRTGNSEDSFVRVQDLIDLGWIEKKGLIYAIRAPVITGSRADTEAALVSLIAGLVQLGLVIDETVV